MQSKQLISPYCKKYTYIYSASFMYRRTTVKQKHIPSNHLFKKKYRTTPSSSLSILWSEEATTRPPIYQLHGPTTLNFVALSLHCRRMWPSCSEFFEYFTLVNHTRDSTFIELDQFIQVIKTSKLIIQGRYTHL